MRLLYCSRDYTTHDLRFVRAITGASIEVHYLRLESDGLRYLADPLPDGACWVPWAGGGAPRSAPHAVAEYLPAFASVLAGIRPDVLHAGPLQTFGLMAALTRKAPTVLVSWGSDVLVDAQRDAWFRWASQTALRHSDAFFCDSAAVLEAARELAGDRLPQHLCVPWGPDALPDRPNPAARLALRRELGWDDSVVVISTRAWHAGYRVPDLVTVFAAAAAGRPRLRLALLSGGPEAPEIQARIASLGIDQLVYRPGVVTQTRVGELLEASDAYLSLVPSDGTSISLLEAMTHGLPVLVARNPGNAEWVSDGTNGYLVGGADRADWVERLVTLVDDPRLASRLGAAARAAAFERADWSRNASRLVDLYHRTAARDPAGHPAP